MQPPRRFGELEDRLRYVFHDENLLDAALTHPTYAHEHGMNPLDDNRRLSFLGDAVIELAVRRFLMKRHPGMLYDGLSQEADKLVDNTTVARAARGIKLGASLRVGRGEDHPEGRDKTKLLADGFEAVVGAIYEDGEPERAFEVALRVLKTEASSERGPQDGT